MGRRNLHCLINFSWAILSSRCLRALFSILRIRFLWLRKSISAETLEPSAYRTQKKSLLQCSRNCNLIQLSLNYCKVFSLTCNVCTFLSSSDMYCSLRTRDRCANCLKEAKANHVMIQKSKVQYHLSFHQNYQYSSSLTRWHAMIIFKDVSSSRVNKTTKNQKADIDDNGWLYPILNCFE